MRAQGGLVSKLRFYRHERAKVGSTNDEARVLALNDAPHCTLVLAREQTKGRGRRGNVWASPPGNLYASLILRPKCSLSTATQLSFVAAVGLGDAIIQYVEEKRIKNKWPNDIQIDGRKVSGLMLEASALNPMSVDWVVVGCGVNIARHPQLSEYETISLNVASGATINIQEFLNVFLHYFETRYNIWSNNGIKPITKTWISRAANLGEEILVRLPRSEVKGIFEGLDGSGALILRREGGIRQIITTGEVFTAEIR